MVITAVANISQVRGGSQARIMLADDSKRYVVKFQGNPQCTRVLANDYLACRMARMIGLSVPEPVLIQVDEQTIQEQQIIHPAGRAVPVRLTAWFCPSDSRSGLAVRSMLARQNLREYRWLAFDKWTGNADGRQVLHKDARGNTPRRSSILVPLQCRRVGFPRRPLRAYALNDSWKYRIVDDFCSVASGSSFPEQQLRHCGRLMRVVRRTDELQRLLNGICGAA